MSTAGPPSARRAVALSFLARHAILLLRAASLVVLSRLLGPAEFGLFASAAAIVALVFVFAEFGLHSHLVRVPRLSRAAIGAAVGVSCALSALALAIVAGLALALPESLLTAEARPVLLLLALATCVTPVALPVTAAMQRRLWFGRLAAVDVGRAAASIGFSIALAAGGHGPMALAWGAVADAVTGTALALALGGGRRPVWPRLSGWRAVLRFGSRCRSPPACARRERRAPPCWLARRSARPRSGCSTAPRPSPTPSTRRCCRGWRRSCCRC